MTNHKLSFNLPDAYRLVEVQDLSEISSTGVLLQHKKSGARVALVLNDDANKVFSIAFRTPPVDSTGAAHIVEHTVLCGSKLFPSKDPFVELVKGSLNTFLNAITYPDKTIYPIASMNDQDFKNLMHVYLDAVFYPNIYRNRAIFMQEGWHYELEEDAEGKKHLELNGVVYNEMKGALSQPDDVLEEKIFEALYPDTPYREESGGEPTHIPELSYEDFLSFHTRYYHPANSYIYLYGNFDPEERLAFLDADYLSAFEEAPVGVRIREESVIVLQEPVEADVTDTYSIAESESEEHKTYLSWNVVLGKAGDPKLNAAIQIIDYILFDAPGAPVKQALIDAGIGDEILSAVHTGIAQPLLSVIAKNADPEQKEAFLTIIRETLEKIVRDGIPEKSLVASLNYFDFKYREADYGRAPKGLLYGLALTEKWLYDESHPFTVLLRAGAYQELRKEVGTDYFTELVRKLFLENRHRAVVTLIPEKGKNEKKDAVLQEKLDQKLAGMSEEEIRKIEEDYAALRAFSDTPSTKEELEKIPMLDRCDIAHEVEGFRNEEKKIAGVPVIVHDYETNGIGYVRVMFRADDLSVRESCVLSLAADLMSMIDTKKHSYADYAEEVFLHTGGIAPATGVHYMYQNPDEMQFYMTVSMKALGDEIGAGLDLTKEVLFESCFGKESDKRILELLRERVSQCQGDMEASGHRTAAGRAMSHVFYGALLSEMTQGIDYYRSVKALAEHFEEKKEALYGEIRAVLEKVLTRDRLLISLTADAAADAKAEAALAAFVEAVPAAENPVKELPKNLQNELKQLLKERAGIRKEAFTTSGQVQYVARCGSYRKGAEKLPFRGDLRILQTMLGYDYLWSLIRVKGGAYGCFGSFDDTGNASFASYRDPNLFETDEVFLGIPEYLAQFEVDERDMTKYIIGTISDIDTPMSPYAKGERSMAALLRGTTVEEMQKTRDQVLDAELPDIRALAVYAKAALADSYLCVVGSEQTIREHADAFDEITSLLG